MGIYDVVIQSTKGWENTLTSVGEAQISIKHEDAWEKRVIANQELHTGV